VILYFTFGIEAIHHSTDYVKFVLNGKVDKVSINNYVIWRTQGFIIFKEHKRRSSAKIIRSDHCIFSYVASITAFSFSFFFVSSSLKLRLEKITTIRETVVSRSRYLLLLFCRTSRQKPSFHIRVCLGFNFPLKCSYNKFIALPFL
jgi:hypothetical protein